MALTLPRHFFYAAIVFTMLVTGVVSLLTMVIDGSDGSTSSAVPELMSSDRVTEFNKTFNIGEDLSASIGDLKSKMQGLKPTSKASVITLPIAFIETSWAMIKFIIDSFGFMDSAFDGLSAFLGIPSWVAGFIIAIIVILFVFSILTIIFGKDT